MLKKYDSLYKPLCLSEKIKKLPKEKREEVEKRKRTMEHELSLFLFNLLDSSFFIYSFNKQVNSTLKMMSLLNNIIIYLDSVYTETENVRKKKEIHQYKRLQMIYELMYSRKYKMKSMLYSNVVIITKMPS